MIFVTVRTHEQQFNRLTEKIDEIAQKMPDEKIIVQYGYSTYIPKNCISKKMMDYDEMEKNYENADIVITHGGPASFIKALQYGKVPIVVPRTKEFSEHVNNHQLEFVKQIEEKEKNIIPIYDINDLEKVIKEYRKISGKILKNYKSNTKNFVENLVKYMEKMYE